MTDWVPVSRDQHIDKRWWPSKNFEFVATKNVIPVLIAELGKLLPHYVLGFTKLDQRFELVALLGLGGTRNLYVDPKGLWLATYIPAALRGYPLALYNTDTKGKKVLCVDASQLTNDSLANPLFNSQGELSNVTSEVFSFLVDCETNRQSTQAAIDKLNSFELIEEWPLPVSETTDGEVNYINGFHRINQIAFEELNNEDFNELRKCDSIRLAYAQIFSMNQWEGLKRRIEYAGEQKDRLNQVLGQGESGSLNFDALN